ncbi:MAG: hypothetical protein ACFNLW_10670, partial [Olsenella sp.]
NLPDFKAVIDPQVAHIALGEPKGVPVGQYSEEVFTKLGILVSGPVTTPPHARQLSCRMIPPRRQESYVSPRRLSVLPTKNHEGPV